MINHVKASKRTRGFHYLYVSGIGIIGQRYISIPLGVDANRFAEMIEILVSDTRVKYKILPRKSNSYFLELSWLVEYNPNAINDYDSIKSSIQNAESHVRSVVREKIATERMTLMEAKTNLGSKSIKQFLYD